jgi:hypothetical protein
MVETRLWFDLGQYGQRKSAWTDIDVLGISKDAAYIVQCKNWPQEEPKTLENQFNLMYKHAMHTHKNLMQNKKRYYILACIEFKNRMAEQRLREQLSNTPHYYFQVWEFEKMAKELVWYIYTHCQNRSLKLDNPLMWLLRNLVYYDLIMEKAWYSDDWTQKPSDKPYSELSDKVKKEAYGSRKYGKSVALFVRRASERYLRIEKAK